MRNFKYCFVICIFAFCILNFIGCAVVKEAAKCTWGVSVKDLKDNRKDAIKQTFSYSYDECYKKVLEGLPARGSYVYARSLKDNLIAIYISEEDTTPVGVFFKAIDEKTTQIEVSSSSTYGKEFIANRVKDILNPKEKKGEANAKKDADK